jgi:hypothetical protein
MEISGWLIIILKEKRPGSFYKKRKLFILKNYIGRKGFYINTCSYFQSIAG